MEGAYTMEEKVGIALLHLERARSILLQVNTLPGRPPDWSDTAMCAMAIQETGQAVSALAELHTFTKVVRFPEPPAVGEGT